MASLDEQARRWDTALDALSVVDVEPETEVLNFLERGPADIGIRGLDIGCGLGRHTLAAAQRGYVMTAVDISRLGVRKTRSLLHHQRFDVGVLVASMTALPFQDEAFDFAFSWCVLN